MLPVAEISPLLGLIPRATSQLRAGQDDSHPDRYSVAVMDDRGGWIEERMVIEVAVMDVETAVI